ARLEHPSQRSKRLPPVTDRVLLLRRQLGHRPVESLGYEDRVVPESAGATGLEDQPALAGRFGPHLCAVRQGKGGDAPVAGPARSRRKLLQPFDQQPEIVPIARSLAREPDGSGARAAAEGADFYTRVVGQPSLPHRGGDP